MLLELAMVLAVQNSTTTCQPNAAGQVVCATKENGAEATGRCARGDWFLAGCTRGEHDEAREARAAQQRAAEARQRTMTLLQGGDCAGAVREALATGDLQFATDVRTFCAAAPAPAQ